MDGSPAAKSYLVFAPDASPHIGTLREGSTAQSSR